MFTTINGPQVDVQVSEEALQRRITEIEDAFEASLDYGIDGPANESEERQREEKKMKEDMIKQYPCALDYFEIMGEFPE